MEQFKEFSPDEKNTDQAEKKPNGFMLVAIVSLLIFLIITMVSIVFFLLNDKQPDCSEQVIKLSNTIDAQQEIIHTQDSVIRSMPGNVNNKVDSLSKK